jgi:hypothetical protein
MLPIFILFKKIYSNDLSNFMFDVKDLSNICLRFKIF